MGGVVGAVLQPVGSILGAATNALGGPENQYQAQAAHVNSPITQQQADEAQQASLDALAQQQALASQLSGVNGTQNQQNTLTQQQNLANQLQNQSNGQGPVQQQFQNNIGAGTQAAAGTIASQKGISPALAAELIARQQGSANQNAAVNAASQQMASQQQLAQQQATMQQVAANQVNQQQAATGANTGAIQNQQQMLLNSIAGVNNANVSAQGTANALNQQTAASNASRQSQMLGGLLGAAGTLGAASIMGGGSSAGGGGVPMGSPSASVGGLKPSTFAKGGEVMPEHLRIISDIYHGPKTEEHDYVMPEKKASGGYAAYQEGALVPGKAKVDHNSYSNDNVKALLSPGEVVIPLNVMNSDNPAQGAAKFVQALMDKKGKDSPKDENSKADFHKSLKEAINKRGKK